MITYKIMKLDFVQNFVQVKYTKEQKEDYYMMQALPVNFNEEIIHDIAEKGIEEAVEYWNLLEEKTSKAITLEVDEKSFKDLEIAIKPDYNDLVEIVVPIYTEDETTRYKNWEVQDLPLEEKAFNIRYKRDSLLKECDNEALIDRSITQELLDYRQSLRDITDQETFPHSVIWPIKPIN
jgi:hypothetical protein